MLVKEKDKMRNRNLKYRFTSLTRTTCLLALVSLMLPIMACSPREDEGGARSSRQAAQTVSSGPASGTRRGDDNEAAGTSGGSVSENPDRGDFKPLYSEIQ